jgi:hypothetical protein
MASRGTQRMRLATQDGPHLAHRIWSVLAHTSHSNCKVIVVRRTGSRIQQSFAVGGSSARSKLQLEILPGSDDTQLCH